MTEKPRKPPTDAAIQKAFKEFESGWNVFMTILRNDPDNDVRERNMQAMWEAHSVARMISVEAHYRQLRRKADSA